MIGDRVYEDAKTVVVDAERLIIQVELGSYIGYSVRNEPFTVWDRAEESEGHAFRTYSKSQYLDFIKSGAIADEVHAGPFGHYGMACLNHVVDVVSASEPVVTEAAHGKV